MTLSLKLLLRETVIVLWMLVALQSLSASQYARIEARLVLTDLTRIDDNGQRVPVNRSFGAQVVIGTEKWYAEIGYLANATEQFLFDGTNTFRTLVVTTNFTPATFERMTGRKLLRFPRFLSTNDAKRVSIIPGGHPLGNPGASAVCLAYCSAWYLKQPERLIPLPREDIRVSFDAFAYLDETKVFEDVLGLPKSIKLTLSHSALARSPLDPRIYRDTVNTANRLAVVRALPDGTEMASYEVSQSTNIMGWNIPVRFTLDQHDTDGSGKLLPFFRISGETISVEIVEELPDSLLLPEEVYRYPELRLRGTVHCDRLRGVAHPAVEGGGGALGCAQ
jgi:hypothetical protein